MKATHKTRAHTQTHIHKCTHTTSGHPYGGLPLARFEGRQWGDQTLPPSAPAAGHPPISPSSLIADGGACSLRASLGVGGCGSQMGPRRPNCD